MNTRDQHMDRLRADLKQGRVFEPLMAQWLLNNPHRLTFTMKPDAAVDANLRAAEDAALAQVRNFGR